MYLHASDKVDYFFQKSHFPQFWSNLVLFSAKNGHPIFAFFPVLTESLGPVENANIFHLGTHQASQNSH